VEVWHRSLPPQGRQIRRHRKRSLNDKKA
jgi:hypothetical protein